MGSPLKHCYSATVLYTIYYLYTIFSDKGSSFKFVFNTNIVRLSNDLMKTDSHFTGLCNPTKFTDDTCTHVKGIINNTNILNECKHH